MLMQALVKTISPEVLRKCISLLSVQACNTRVVQKVLQMLGFHRYMRLILAKFVMLE